MSEIENTSHEVTFSKQEAQVLAGIVRREKILQDLSKAVSGLEALNRIAGMVVKGPVKLLFQWNKAAIEGWKRANSLVGNIAHAETCKDINLMWVDAVPGSENARFWANLKAVEGC